MKIAFKSSVWIAITLFVINEVYCAPGLSAPTPKGDSPLLNSYLPAAMQVLAHLTNQMKFERPEATTSKPVTTVATTTTTEPTTTTIETTTASAETTTVPPEKETNAPVQAEEVSSSTTPKTDQTTQSHSPGVFAPVIPPNPEVIKQIIKSGGASVLPLISSESSEYPEAVFLPSYQPYSHNVPLIVPQVQAPVQYVRNPVDTFPIILYPQIQDTQSEDTGALYLPGNYQLNPADSDLSLIARSGDVDGFILTEGADSELPDISMLPVQNEDNFKYNPLEIEPAELSEDNLQYLTPGVREALRNFRDDGDVVVSWNPEASFQSIEELFDDTGDNKDVHDWLRLRKAPPTQSLIQMLLLYDLLSRDAKKQKLNNYHGYTDDMVHDLAEISTGTAIDQLKAVLERMVARGDCTYEFANNRAKEMVTALEKPDSNMSKELRYLEPLRYTE